MILELLEKANELKAEIDAIVELKVLVRNASMEGAELRAYCNNKMANKYVLWPEITTALLDVLQAEQSKIEHQLEEL